SIQAGMMCCLTKRKIRRQISDSSFTLRSVPLIQQRYAFLVPPDRVPSLLLASVLIFCHMLEQVILS
ncbi:MAG: hypothetical protein WAX34_04585, partial [Trichococcus flocculiformis]